MFSLSPDIEYTPTVRVCSHSQCIRPVNFLHDMFLRLVSCDTEATMVTCAAEYDIGLYLSSRQKYIAYRILMLVRYMIESIKSVGIPSLPKKLGCLDGLLVLLRFLVEGRDKGVISLSIPDALSVASDLSMTYGFPEIDDMAFIIDHCLLCFSNDIHYRTYPIMLASDVDV